MAELNGIDPDKKKKIALAIKKMQADGVSDEKISAAVKKFMATDSSTVKKKSRYSSRAKTFFENGTSRARRFFSGCWKWLNRPV
jgi:hypothetical protein